MTTTPSSSDLTLLTRRLLERLPPERWATIEERAHERVRLLDDVAAARGAGLSRRKALGSVAPDLPWPTYLYWCRRAREREGAPWERQLDARVPPRPPQIRDDVVSAACLLRRMDPAITCEAAQDLLVKQFGPERGRVSATVLKRVWKEAGLEQPPGLTKPKLR